MKLDRALELGDQGQWQDAQVRVSPNSRKQWFVMLRDIRQNSFVLADNENKPIATENINELASIIRSIGLKEFTVHF